MDTETVVRDLQVYLIKFKTANLIGTYEVGKASRQVHQMEALLDDILSKAVQDENMNNELNLKKVKNIALTFANLRTNTYQIVQTVYRSTLNTNQRQLLAISSVWRNTYAMSNALVTDYIRKKPNGDLSIDKILDDKDTMISLINNFYLIVSGRQDTEVFNTALQTLGKALEINLNDLKIASGVEKDGGLKRLAYEAVTLKAAVKDIDKHPQGKAIMDMFIQEEKRSYKIPPRMKKKALDNFKIGNNFEDVAQSFLDTKKYLAEYFVEENGERGVIPYA